MLESQCRYICTDDLHIWVHSISIKNHASSFVYENFNVWAKKILLCIVLDMLKIYCILFLIQKRYWYSFQAGLLFTYAGNYLLPACSRDSFLTYNSMNGVSSIYSRYLCNPDRTKLGSISPLFPKCKPGSSRCELLCKECLNDFLLQYSQISFSWYS